MTGLKGREFHNAAKQMAAVGDMTQAILYFYEAIEHTKVRRSCVLIDDCHSWLAAADAVTEARNGPIWGRRRRVSTALFAERQKAPPVLQLPRLRVRADTQDIGRIPIETLYYVNPETCEIFVDAGVLLSTRDRQRLVEQFGTLNPIVAIEITDIDNKLMRRLIDAL